MNSVETRHSCLLLRIGESRAGYSVTAEAAGSSPVVPAIPLAIKSESHSYGLERKGRSRCTFCCVIRFSLAGYCEASALRHLQPAQIHRPGQRLCSAKRIGAVPGLGNHRQTGSLPPVFQLGGQGDEVVPTFDPRPLPISAPIPHHYDSQGARSHPIRMDEPQQRVLNWSRVLRERHVKLEDLAGQCGEWLRGSGPESDIVISSRIRLARNLAEFPFIRKCTDQDRAQVERVLRERIQQVDEWKNLSYVDVATLEDVDRQFLVERQLISREHSEAEGARSVAIDPHEKFSLMVNEEDHLRIQVMQSGLDLQSAWERINQIDDFVEERLTYADEITHLRCHLDDAFRLDRFS